MKRKLSVIVAALTVLAVQAYAQESYTVTRVSGKAVNSNTGAEVRAGDVLQPSDKVTFSTFDSYIVAIGRNMERYMLKMHLPPSPDGVQQLTVAAEEVAVPTKRRSLMSQRYRPDEKTVADLKGYFGNDKFSVIGDRVSIPVSAESYPIDENRFIVFYYRVNNNPVSKKIGYEQNTLLVEKDKLLITGSGSITSNEIPSVAIYLYEKSSRTSEEITKFDLVFVDREELMGELYTILPILRRQKMGNDDIKKYLIEYYFDFYGATDSRTIKQLVDGLVDNANS